MKKSFRTLVSALAFSCTAFAAQAAVIANYDLAPYNGDGSLEATATAPGFTSSAITKQGALSGSFSNHFYFTGWGASLDSSKYLQVSLSSVSPFALSQMLFSVESTSSALASVAIRSSLDGFSSNVDLFSWASPSGDVTNADFDLSSLGVINGAIDLRMYFWTSSPSFTVGFANHELGGTGGGLPDTGRDISFIGDTVEVPEPGSLALAGLAFGALLGLRRRKQVS